MAKGLDIRRRIKSVKSTRSITKAMQMVAASKMRKAQEQALKTRSYAEKALEILATLSEKVGDYHHYLLDKSDGKRYLILLITANKGLCGALNTNVIRKAIDFMESKKNVTIPEEKEEHITKDIEKEIFHFTTMGKKGRDSMLRLGKVITADFSDIGDHVSFLDIAPITKQLLDEYKGKKYDRIYIVYTHFVSVLVQKPVIRRVVPLGRDILDSLKSVMTKKQVEHVVSDEEYEYLFEPNPQEVLDELLPRLVEMQIYQAVLEANASEQSARMVAMKNATEAAGDLIDDLTLSFNKMRQSAITQEISEIVGGVEALKKR
jgi:F-type H+-transporting ATPase subunit gamma